MSAAARFKLLIKVVWLASMIVGPAGCIGISPSLKLGEPQKVTIQGQETVYLPMSISNAIGVNATIIDRYQGGKLVGHDSVVNNGLLETLGGSALTTVVPAASALGLVK